MSGLSGLKFRCSHAVLAGVIAMCGAPAVTLAAGGKGEFSIPMSERVDLVKAGPTYFNTSFVLPRDYRRNTPVEIILTLSANNIYDPCAIILKREDFFLWRANAVGMRDEIKVVEGGIVRFPVPPAQQHVAVKASVFLKADESVGGQRPGDAV